MIRQKRILGDMSPLEEDDKKNQHLSPLDDEPADRLEIDDQEKDHPEEKEPQEEEKKEQTQVASKEAMLRVIGGQP